MSQDRIFPKDKYVALAVTARNILSDYANRVVPKLREVVSRAKFKNDGQMFEKDHRRANEILQEGKPKFLRAFVSYQYSHAIYVHMDITHEVGDSGYLNADYQIGDRLNTPPAPWEPLEMITLEEAQQNIRDYETACQEADKATRKEWDARSLVVRFWESTN
jgi:hypothetical protein